MVLFQQVYNSLIVKIVVLSAGFKLELPETEEHGVVDVETNQFPVGIL